MEPILTCEMTKNNVESNNYQHIVYKNNPVYFLSLVNEYILVRTKYDVELTGFVDAIDPVTQSIIISTNENGVDRVVIIMGHTIVKLELSEPPSGCLRRSPKNSDQIYTPDILLARKNNVFNWLSKNLLPVEYDGDSLKVHGGHLHLPPPYRAQDCISNNSIILGRIQHLLQNMPTNKISPT